MEQEFKKTLVRYLQTARDALLWKLEGLEEYDVRRPLTPTGTNLLGLVKHCAGVEAEYFGACLGREHDVPAAAGPRAVRRLPPCGAGRHPA